MTTTPILTMNSNNHHHHCLDINYRTEIELKTISTYLFILIVIFSFTILHINRFMNHEIKRLYTELDFIKKSIGESTSGSGSGSEDSSSSSDGEGTSEGESESESEDESEQEEIIKFKGRRYVMN